MRSKIFPLGLLFLALTAEAAVFKLPFNTTATQLKKALAAPAPVADDAVMKDDVVMSDEPAMAEEQEEPAQDAPMPKSFSKIAVTSTALQVASAVYFQTNCLDSPNEIIACGIKEDGTINTHKRYKTGGKGGASLAKVKSKAIGPATDALFSQHSVIVGGNYLFTVNAGSNTVSMFIIDKEDPLKLVQGIQCMDTEPLKRRIGNTKDSKDSMAGTVSDMFFTKDDKALIVITKGSTIAKQPSIVDAYAAIEAKTKVSVNTVRTTLKNAPQLFGAVQINDTWIYATDGSYGLAKLQFDPKSRKIYLKKENQQQIDFQSQTGWIAESPKIGSVYVADLKMNRIVEFNVNDANKTSEQSFLSAQPGNMDIAIGGDFLYTLSPANKALASNVSMVQIMNLKSKGYSMDIGAYVFEDKDNITAQAHGMAIYTKPKVKPVKPKVKPEKETRYKYFF
ncbi:hypothetical protein ABW20_dc0104595 [Dactylellina cionopaga]|nr:hypothetical protein ABW20_dc0104595 [Dactylellina cionopaga]